MKFFDIKGSREEPEHKYSSPGRPYRVNITCHVVATSARRAMELVIAKYPGIDIHSLQHGGAIDIIEEESALMKYGST